MHYLIFRYLGMKISINGRKFVMQNNQECNEFEQEEDQEGEDDTAPPF